MMSATKSTSLIYDTHANHWQRSGKLLLSDFTARPLVIEELSDLQGTHVLDLGCGEGYVSRLIAERGARSVFGVDISQEMIQKAQDAVPSESGTSFMYRVGDAATTQFFPRPSFERIVAVFLFNYLTRAEMTQVLTVAWQKLTPGGIFVFTVPHPCLPYMRAAEPPFYFETEDKNYFDGVDATFEGKIWRRDGIAVPVRCVHKTFADYFDALRTAGFVQLPKVVELKVASEHVSMDPDFFGPLLGFPLHLLFRLEKPL